MRLVAASRRITRSLVAPRGSGSIFSAHFRLPILEENRNVLSLFASTRPCTSVSEITLSIDPRRMNSQLFHRIEAKSIRSDAEHQPSVWRRVARGVPPSHSVDKESPKFWELSILSQKFLF